MRPAALLTLILVANTAQAQDDYYTWRRLPLIVQDTAGVVLTAHISIEGERAFEVRQRGFLVSVHVQDMAGCHTGHPADGRIVFTRATCDEFDRLNRVLADAVRRYERGRT